MISQKTQEFLYDLDQKYFSMPRTERLQELSKLCGRERRELDTKLKNRIMPVLLDEAQDLKELSDSAIDLQKTGIDLPLTTQTYLDQSEACFNLYNALHELRYDLRVCILESSL